MIYSSGIKVKLPVIISPYAYVSPYAQIGCGTIVMHNAIINADARVGDNCIINSRALIEHDVVIGNHCHISTGAVVNGAVEVGDNTFIGSGASSCSGGQNSVELIYQSQFSFYPVEKAISIISVNLRSSIKVHAGN